MVAPAGTDAHNPLLIHLKPSDMEWKEKRSYMHPAKQQEEIRKDMDGYGRIFKSRISEKVRALVMIRYWTLHGTTGMAVASGHRTPTLDMVHPHLLQQGYGDQRTGECTLLKNKITQDDFALYSFSASSSIFAHSYQKEIIPFMCTEFRLFQC